MSIDLVTKFIPYVDEQFATEGKSHILTNKDFDFTGAKTVKIYKVTTSKMNDYDREGKNEDNISRYGALKNLETATEEFMLSRDRSFTFPIDKLDEDETMGVLTGATALARQIREVVVPEYDAYIVNKIITGAGETKSPIPLKRLDLLNSLMNAIIHLDEAEVPEDNRVLVLSPTTYTLLLGFAEGQTVEVKGDTTTQSFFDMAPLKNYTIVKMPSKRLTKEFGFLLLHPMATVAPIKLADYKIHQDPIGISGSLIEGRIVYDAFILDNKKQAIVYQPIIPTV